MSMCIQAWFGSTYFYVVLFISLKSIFLIFNDFFWREGGREKSVKARKYRCSMCLLLLWKFISHFYLSKIKLLYLSHVIIVHYNIFISACIKVCTVHFFFPMAQKNFVEHFFRFSYILFIYCELQCLAKYLLFRKQLKCKF